MWQQGALRFQSGSYLGSEPNPIFSSSSGDPPTALPHQLCQAEKAEAGTTNNGDTNHYAGVSVQACGRIVPAQNPEFAFAKQAI